MTVKTSGDLLAMDVTGEACDLRAIGITKHYDSFTLDNVTLEVPRGYVVGLVGQNGAGKTTLMRAMLGIIRADAGRIELFGEDVSAMGQRELLAAKARVGFVSAVIGYPSALTVAQVKTMYEMAYPAFDRAACDALLTRLGLVGAEKKHVSELSRGMGMKLQLACTLATSADVLVLDEPTAGLDPIVRDEVLDVIREWMRDGDKSALISSHITSDLEKIADYVVMIEGGRVMLSLDRDGLESYGVAHLRSSELERVLADGFIAPGHAYVLDRHLERAMLVPDRAAFKRAYPDYVCDPASIDDVMTLLVRGEVR